MVDKLKNINMMIAHTCRHSDSEQMLIYGPYKFEDSFNSIMNTYKALEPDVEQFSVGAIIRTKIVNSFYYIILNEDESNYLNEYVEYLGYVHHYLHYHYYFDYDAVIPHGHLYNESMAENRNDDDLDYDDPHDYYNKWPISISKNIGRPYNTNELYTSISEFLDQECDNYYYEYKLIKLESILAKPSLTNFEYRPAINQLWSYCICINANNGIAYYMKTKNPDATEQEKYDIIIKLKKHNNTIKGYRLTSKGIILVTNGHENSDWEPKAQPYDVNEVVNYLSADDTTILTPTDTITCDYNPMIEKIDITLHGGITQRIKKLESLEKNLLASTKISEGFKHQLKIIDGFNNVAGDKLNESAYQQLYIDVNNALSSIEKLKNRKPNASNLINDMNRSIRMYHDNRNGLIEF